MFNSNISAPGAGMSLQTFFKPALKTEANTGQPMFEGASNWLMAPIPNVGAITDENISEFDKFLSLVML